MVINKENPVIFSFFSWYISRIVKKHFAGIDFNLIDIDPEKAVLLIANHYSWWDGFVYFQLNKLLFKKKFHVMILEDTIRKNPFMKYTGAFSVSKGSKDMLETLHYAGQLLLNPQNLILIFPQGKLYSNFSSKIKFEKGLSKIISADKKNFIYVFAASFTEYFAKPKPTVFIYLEKHDPANLIGFKNVDDAYCNHYQKSAALQTAIVK